MILSRKRPWEPEEEKQLREMAEAGKTITMIALRLKRTVTDVRGRLSILKVSLHKVRAETKENPDGVMALPPDERRDRARINEAVRDGLKLGPLRRQRGSIRRAEGDGVVYRSPLNENACCDGSQQALH